MHERVLVSTDGSPTAERAIEQAIDLAERHGAELHALFVVDIGRAPLGAREDEIWAPVVQAVRDQGKEATGRVRQAAREAGVEVVRSVVEDESPERGILAYVDEHDIDVIVIGTHGRSGPKRWLLGSVADRVIRGSPVPVLVVPPADEDAQA